MMKFLWRQKNTLTKPFSDKIANRVSKISAVDLDMWADQSLYELGRLLSQYQKNKEKGVLEEARMGAEALHALVEEMYKRHQDKW